MKALTHWLMILALLAGDLSLALQATMLGLWIAVPMTLFGAMIGVRIGRLQDSVQDQMGEFLHDLEIVMRSPDHQRAA